MNTSTFRPFGTWLKDAWHHYRQGFSLYVQFGGMMILANLPTFLMNPRNSIGGFEGLLAWVWGIAIGVPTVIAMIMAVADGSQHKSFEEYYRRSFSRFLPFIWVQILVGVIVFLGFLLLIVPGIIWAVQYSFAGIIMVLEGKHGMDALRQSKQYVKGNWWQLAIRSLGLAILVGIAAAVLAVVFGPLINLLAIFLYPLFIALAYFLYQDLKSSKLIQAPPQEQVAQPIP
jgi:hypothetical protein